MKLKVKTSWWKKLITFLTGRKFTNITVTMELETPNECRTMFHVLNNCNLQGVIINKNYYGDSEFKNGRLSSEYSRKLDNLNCSIPNEQHLVVEMNKQNISTQANGHLEYK